MAQHAVVDLAQDLAWLHARVGQREAVAAPQPIVGTEHPFRQVGTRPVQVDEARVVERFGKPEDDPLAVRGIGEARRAPPLETLDL